MKVSDQRVVIVTGSGRGIGAAVARRFAAEGAAVAVVDLDHDRASDIVQELERDGQTALAVSCDVSSSEAVDDMVAAVIEAYGRIDVLVNCAGGYALRRSVVDTTEEDWDMVIDSNLKGTFLCIRAVLPHMVDGGAGRIINFASNAARSTATALGCEYTAAKAGVLGLTRHVALEYARQGVRVNTLAPGPTDVERLHDSVSPEEVAAIEQAIPVGRLATPEEIAAVTVFLASEAAGYITGAIVDVNGGVVMP